jgi:hypothetical protein
MSFVLGRSRFNCPGQAIIEQEDDDDVVPGTHRSVALPANAAHGRARVRVHRRNGHL